VNLAESVDFYTQLLGFKPSDALDFAKAPWMPEDRSTLGNTRGYFMRYGTDHHAFVLFNKKVMDFREQIGWDGKVRPQSQRRAVQVEWPETLEPLSDTYVDQVFQGPLG
jgi:catechol 2,3-dioxygenase-like lactoylglutathione lyase family enzyme